MKISSDITIKVNNDSFPFRNKCFPRDKSKTVLGETSKIIETERSTKRVAPEIKYNCG